MLTYRLPIGTYFGIPLFIHWTFGLLLVWISWLSWMDEPSISYALFNVGAALSLFICITMHEYGHALMARRFNIHTRDITLLPIGGVARLDRIPREPGQEFLIAVAGPAVNVVIATVIFLGSVAIGHPILEIDLDHYWSALLWLNLFLVAFNMLPLFPMDGGRVFRSLLAMFLPYGQATRIAGRLGLVLGILLASVGFYYTQDIKIMLLAMFVVWAGANEMRMVLTHERVGNLKVRDVMTPLDGLIDGESTINTTLAALTNSSQRVWPVVYGSTYHGMVRYDQLRSASDAGIGEQRVASLALIETIPVFLDDPLSPLLGQKHRGETIPVVGPSYDVVGILQLDRVLAQIQRPQRSPESQSPARANDSSGPSSLNHQPLGS